MLQCVTKPVQFLTAARMLLPSIKRQLAIRSSGLWLPAFS